MLSSLRKRIYPDVWMNAVCTEFPKLHDLVVSMTSDEPSDRPCAQAILKSLHSILDSFTISSFDNNDHEGAILLRIEMRPRDGVLQHTMELVKQAAIPVSVDIVQYGLRGGSNGSDMISIMEFAIVQKEDEECEDSPTELGASLVSKLTDNDEVLLARQVLGSKQRYHK